VGADEGVRTMSGRPTPADLTSDARGLREYLPVLALAALGAVFLFGLGDLAWGVVFGLRVRLVDDAFARGVLALRDPGTALVLGWFTRLGDAVAAAVLVAVVAAGLWIAGRRPETFFLLGVTASAALVNAGLKDLFDRTRPSAMLAAVPLPHSASFPSGHAVIGLTFGGALAIILMLDLGMKRGISPAVLLIAVGALLGVSRIYLGIHWLTDVLGGWLLALAVLCLWSAGWIWLLVREERQLVRLLAGRV
jgi:membrane-associated phospholipid phosphatase